MELEVNGNILDNKDSLLSSFIDEWLHNIKVVMVCRPCRTVTDIVTYVR
jgi:hypothetical protein